VNIHIIQCDDSVKADKKITSQEELKEYMDNLELHGEGGTDFRPAFAYVEELMRNHAFSRLKGLLYFTDGQGIYPQKRPLFETAFVFMKEDYEDVDVPAWAMKLILEEERYDEHKESETGN
jgi:predicted metal-dependent peptidase